MRAAMENRRWTVDFYNFTVELASLGGELAGSGTCTGVRCVTGRGTGHRSL